MLVQNYSKTQVFFLSRASNSVKGFKWIFTSSMNFGSLDERDDTTLRFPFLVQFYSKNTELQATNNYFPRQVLYFQNPAWTYICTFNFLI